MNNAAIKTNEAYLKLRAESPEPFSKELVAAAWGLPNLLPAGAIVAPYELVELRVMVPADFSSSKQQRLITLIHDHISELQDDVCRRFDGARVEVH